ncbi:MAG TPA: cupin-like domain-containing protein [Solirubrobacteraceae bacterium]|jgi:lysine-specific demethylase 8
MTSATAPAPRLAGGREMVRDGALEDARSALPVLTREEWSRHRRALCAAGTAAIIADAVPADVLEGWTPEAIAETCGDLEVVAFTALPRHGVPYAAREAMGEQRLVLRDFVAHLRGGAAGYLTQAPLARFGALLDRLPVRAPHDEHTYSTNLWLGAATRSGLHYDSADNLFVQLYGTKRAILSPCRAVRRLHPFPDNPSKSSVDFEDPAWREAYPRTAGASLLELDVRPGEVVYIPRGWWHYFAADEPAVSVNIWFGRTLTQAEHLRRLASAGTAPLARLVRDVVAVGVLGRPYEQRPYSPPPLGVSLARRLRLRTPPRKQ